MYPITSNLRYVCNNVSISPNMSVYSRTKIRFENIILLSLVASTKKPGHNTVSLYLWSFQIMSGLWIGHGKKINISILKLGHGNLLKAI